MIQPNPESPVNYLPEIDNSYDVIVVGGGPAGSSTAALVAEHGHNTLLLERAELPRFHVGESLIPETYWPLKRLGLIDRLKESAFPRKYSVQFVSEGVKESAPFYFDMYNPHESSVTWQVERGKFDQMVMDRARELGGSGWVSADGGTLHRELGEARFLAFVHLGEDRARLRERPQGCIFVEELRPLAISSTEIRELLHSGKSARYLLPEPVLDYIETNRLYR